MAGASLKNKRAAPAEADGLFDAKGLEDTFKALMNDYKVLVEDSK
jgi:hypothetical protein